MCSSLSGYLYVSVSLSLPVCVYLLLLLGLLQHAKLPRAVLLVQVSSGEEKLSLI